MLTYFPDLCYSTDGSITWNCPNGVKIGVNIHVPLQIGPFGTAPYFQVWDSVNGGNEVKWTKPNSYPSTPYNFPTNIGYKVRVTPTAGSYNMTLAITVEDLSH